MKKPTLKRNVPTLVDAALAACKKPGDWRRLRTASTPGTAQSYAAFLRRKFGGHEFTTRGAEVWGARK